MDNEDKYEDDDLPYAKKCEACGSKRGYIAPKTLEEAQLRLIALDAVLAGFAHRREVSIERYNAGLISARSYENWTAKHKVALGYRLHERVMLTRWIDGRKSLLDSAGAPLAVALRELHDAREKNARLSKENGVLAARLNVYENAKKPPESFKAFREQCLQKIEADNHMTRLALETAQAEGAVFTPLLQALLDSVRGQSSHRTTYEGEVERKGDGFLAHLRRLVEGAASSRDPATEMPAAPSEP